MNLARLSGIAWMLAAAFLLAAAGLAACDVPRPLDRGRLAITFAATSELRQALVVGEGEDAVDVSRLELRVRELKLLPDGGEDAPDRVQARGDFPIDVLDPDADWIDIDVDPGRYKKLELKIARPDAGEGIDGTDAALWLEGTRGDVAFRFVDDEMMKLTFRDVDIDVAAGAVEDVLVDLDVSRWLDGVDLEALEANPDGLVEITADGPNAPAHRQIERNVTDAIRAARHPRR